MVSKYAVDTFIAYGKYAKEMAKGAKRLSGKGNVITCSSPVELEELLMPLDTKESAVLMKTSMKERTLTGLMTKLRKKNQ